MEELEYKRKQILLAIEPLDKESLYKTLKKTINFFGVEECNLLLQHLSLNKDEYLFNEKDRIIKNLMKIEIINIKGTITHAYNYYDDDDYDKTLACEDENFLHEAIRLLFLLFDVKDYSLANKIMKKLKSIKFHCSYYDEYNDDAIEYEMYHIDEFLYDIIGKDNEQKFNEIYLLLSIYFKNYEALNEIVLNNKYNQKELNSIFKKIDSENKQCLYSLLKNYCFENIDISYPLELLNDYPLYKYIAKYTENDEVLISFIKKYNNLNEAQNKDVNLIIDNFLAKIEKSNSHFHLKIFMFLIEYYKNNTKYILKYYDLFDGANSFLLFNYLDNDLFEKYIKNEDKKYLLIPNESFDYFSDRLILKAIFKTINKDDKALYLGSLNFLKRVKCNKDQLLNQIKKYAINQFVGEKSKHYNSILLSIKELEEDIGSEINLFNIISKEYPNRPSLKEKICHFESYLSKK